MLLLLAALFLTCTVVLLYYSYTIILSSSFATMPGKHCHTPMSMKINTNLRVNGAEVMMRIIVLVIMAFVFAVLEQNHIRCIFMNMAAIINTMRRIR